MVLYLLDQKPSGMRGRMTKDLHPDFLLGKAPAVIRTSRLIQLILSYNGDSTDPILRKRMTSDKIGG